MAINFNSFTEGTTSNIQSNDYVVGFDNTNPGGERKWTVSTIANAVSGITNLNRLSYASGVNGILKCNGLGNFSAAVAGTDYFPSSGFALFYPPEISYTFTSITFNNWVRIDFGTTPIGSPKPPLNARFAYCRLIGDSNSAQALTMFSRSSADGTGYVVSSGYDQTSDYVFLPIYNNGIDIFASGFSGTGWTVTAFGYLL